MVNVDNIWQQCGIRVAVIDDGVCKESYQGIFVKESYLVAADGSINEYWCKKEESKHGSVCAAIISKYAPGIPIISLKVLDSPVEEGAIDKVITALKWCEKHAVKVCHLSIGIKSVKYYGLFQTLIDRMKRKGHMIIAAMANDNGFALPACLNGVISVKADNSLLSNDFYHGKGRFGEPVFFAASEHVLHDINGNEIFVEGGNSFAAPVITAAVVYKRLCDERQGSACNKDQKMKRNNWDYLRRHFDTCHGVSVPVVVFYGENDKIINQACRFKHYLECNDYLTIVVTDRNYQGKELLVSLDENRNIDESLAIVQEYYDVDLIILCVREKKVYINGDLFVGEAEQRKYEDIVAILNEGE